MSKTFDSSQDEEIIVSLPTTEIDIPPVTAGVGAQSDLSAASLGRMDKFICPRPHFFGDTFTVRVASTPLPN